MPSLTTNPTRHRAQIVAEAVVSAYIHEIAQPQRPGARADARVERASTVQARPSSFPCARRRTRAIARPRRRPVELAA